MKDIRLKILLTLLILVPIPFSCEDKNDCLDLYVEPYYDIQNVVFKEVDLYYLTNGEYLNLEPIEQNYANQVYACDSLALYFMAPDTSLLFHSQRIITPGFNFIQTAYACNSQSPGYAGTRELVDKIYISSNAEFDEKHGINYDLSDIVKIFAYTKTGNNSWATLSDYNHKSPYEAPKRFYLLFTQKPTKSKTHQFTIKYYMKTEPGEAAEAYFIKTPVLQLR